MQQCLFDAAVFISNALNIQELKGFESPNAPANRLQRVWTGTSLGMRPRASRMLKYSKTQRFDEPEG
jgi:hypothetical protein